MHRGTKRAECNIPNGRESPFPLRPAPRDHAPMCMYVCTTHDTTTTTQASKGMQTLSLALALYLIFQTFFFRIKMEKGKMQNYFSLLCPRKNLFSHACVCVAADREFLICSRTRLACTHAPTYVRTYMHAYGIRCPEQQQLCCCSPVSAIDKEVLCCGNRTYLQAPPPPLGSRA